MNYPFIYVEKAEELIVLFFFNGWYNN